MTQVSTNKMFPKFIIFTLSGLVLTLLTGYLFFGGEILNIRQPVFGFTAYGITGSFFFGLLMVRRFRDAIFAIILLFALNLFLTHARFLVAQFLFFSTSIIAVLIYWARIYGNGRSWRWMRPLSLSGLFGVFYIGITVLLGIIYLGGVSRPLSNLSVGFLIGLGLGLGFELGDWLVQRFLNTESSNQPSIST